ncbi:MAG: carbamoyl-phosphate synthase large subunit [Thiotrichales bacterium]|nr:carbamoyl-phosphate synthase large subunit [Thiotrichales bacterium]
MPRRSDIETILIVGAGPIVIGQACEVDYSGVQACKALSEEGFRVVLVNSNPATIMTDPGLADATYIEPVHWKVVARIIEKERPDALLPTMGGQTGLNCSLDLVREGVLEAYAVELVGASRKAIDKAEDREQFRAAMARIGLECPQGALVRNIDEAVAVQPDLGFPAIIRPSFTLGGTGGGIAYNREEFVDICERGLEASPTTEVLIEESVLGWKEFEMEVVRDRRDNCIVVCSIENLDPMGIHTGDSITVAPAQTLTDKEYQRMRNASIEVLREIGVDTGGSNVQFAVNPDDGRMVVIEMNPRVSRSSALASKATGFPIARVAAKLAVGYTLDELDNEITGRATPASFEPSIDYVVTKIPRFDFEKFPQADSRLTTQMKSVGEVMAVGRTFQESLQKALRSLEVGLAGLDEIVTDHDDRRELECLRRELRDAGPHRLRYLADALRLGVGEDEVQRLSRIDPWFIAQVADLVREERELATRRLDRLEFDALRRLKRKGFSDARIATLLGAAESEVRAHRKHLGLHPVFKRIDSCAAEFRAATAYMYSTYEEECEAEPTAERKIVVLGGGPNRIGQGIEFDYCCVQAALAMRESGYESIMVNCNPETVSTDYDTSDRLYFEPLTLEDVLEIVRVERPEGVIVQYGGQTPLKLARALEAEGVRIVGTTPDSIDLAEDRERFQHLIEASGLRQPPNRTARTPAEAVEQAAAIGYPIVVRPSYVLGGRAMKIVYDEDELSQYMRHAVDVSNESPVLLDRFLDDAIEVDVDCASDGRTVFVGGIMEHIEQAGIHSGDSACSLPPTGLSEDVQARLREQTRLLAEALHVVGLMNVQYAIKDESIYVLEVNPRASRTVPFVSKAIGVPLAKVAAQCMVGLELRSFGLTRDRRVGHYSVKEAVFPFVKFPGVDSLLGPEMQSPGEVMGVGRTFGEAFSKALLATGDELPPRGTAFVSVRDGDKRDTVEVSRSLQRLGYEIVATRGTARTLNRAGVRCRTVNKVLEGRPHVVDMLKNDEIDMIVNTTEGSQAIADSYTIRRTALQYRVPYFTTVAGARALVEAMRAPGVPEVRSMQEIHMEVGS